MKKWTPDINLAWGAFPDIHSLSNTTKLILLDSLLQEVCIQSGLVGRSPMSSLIRISDQPQLQHSPRCTSYCLLPPLPSCLPRSWPGWPQSICRQERQREKFIYFSKSRKYTFAWSSDPELLDSGRRGSNRQMSFRLLSQSAPTGASRNCLNQLYFKLTGRGIGYSFQLAITASLYSIIDYCITAAQSYGSRVLSLVLFLALLKRFFLSAQKTFSQ